tara:strand:+ start:613 stop:1095 length:483 start_codon:yes stop_codon:yes gene_type:complete
MNNGLVPDIKDRISDYKEVDENILYSNYKQYSLKGIIEDNKLSNYFFSEENIELIQGTIRYNIFQKKKKIISKQSREEIFTIMRSIYLQSGSTRISTDRDVSNTIDRLNKMVIDYSVEHILSKLNQYDLYLNDISKLPEPMERPKYDKITTSYDMSNILF